MPNPTPNSVHVNRPLTNISISWKQDNNDFVADRVFPVVPVKNQGDEYYVYDRAYWHRSNMQERAPATESAGGGFKLTTANYFAKVFALHQDVDDQTRANADAAISLDQDATEWLMEQAMIKKEVDFAAKYMTGGVWTFEADGVASGQTAPASFDPTDDANNNLLTWTDDASTPIEDIRRAKLTVKAKTGKTPNVMTLGARVYNRLLDHPDIIVRLDSGQTPGGPAMTTRQSLAAILELDEILVSMAVVDSSTEGGAADSDFVFANQALLSYRPARPGLRTPSAGYTFGWTGYLGGSVGAFQISRFRMDHLKADRIEGEMAYDQKIVSADLGYLFDSIVL